MKRLVLLLLLASLLVACESNPGLRPYPGYRYDDTWWECKKVHESGGWSAGADFPCPR